VFGVESKMMPQALSGNPICIPYPAGVRCAAGPAVVAP
jgi:hypothetical protein